MKSSRFLLPILFFLCMQSVQAQYWNGIDSLYGNEWVKYDQAYFKINVAEDGIYRIPQTALFKVADSTMLITIPSENYHLYRNGKEVSIFTSNTLSLGSNDFIEFYGEKNRGEFDAFLFANPQKQHLNPEYSMSTDTAAYYLTWDKIPSTKRYKPLTNGLNNLPAKEASCWVEQMQVFKNTLIEVHPDSENKASTSEYDTEGYANDWTSNSAITITPTQAFVGTENPKLEIRLGLHRFAHQVEFKINGTSVKKDTINGTLVKTYKDFDIPATALNKAIVLNIINNTTANKGDQHALASVKLTYTHDFNFEGKPSFVFSIPASVDAKYLEITNFKTTGNPTLYDLTTLTRLEATFDAGKVKVALPPSSVERTFLLVASITTVTNLGKVTFKDYSNTNAEYVFLSNKRLFDDGVGNNPLQAYASYRASQQGGNYKTAIIDVEDLYEQFGYGIARHPLAVRNFVQYMNDKWKGSLQYILLVGKGREYKDLRTNAAVAAAQSTFFVPTFGYPGSDNLLVSNNYTSLPAVPVGRIPAINGKEVMLYLDKIKDYETPRPYSRESQEWKKQAVLLSGGSDPAEQQAIAIYMRNMASTLEKGKLGSSPTLFYKTSADPIQLSVSENLFKIVKEGTPFVTFFGHSASTALDFSADDPYRYEITEGHYPLVVGLGCASGNIHLGIRSVGERFCFVPIKDRGAHSFLATTGLGYSNALYQLMNRFYELIGSKMYGASQGEVLRQAIKELVPNSGFDIGLQQLNAQFTLCGDPALKVELNNKPDYLPNIKTLSYEPKVITAQMKTFDLHCDVINLGKSIKDSIDVVIVQELPNKSIDTLLRQKYIPAPAYTTQNLIFKLPVLGNKAIGLNKLFVYIDTKNRIEEGPSPEGENNNSLIVEPFYIVDNDAIPIYPNDFSIVNTTKIILKASTSDAFAPNRKYIMEFDTTQRFDSPSRLHFEKEQKGGVIEWQVPTTLKDSVVYYWRVSPDSIANIGKAWKNSSFIYLKSKKEGWSQAHYHQFLADEYKNILLKDTRKYEYVNELIEFRIVCNNEPIANTASTKILLGPTRINPFWPETPEGVHVVVLNQVDLKPWKNFDGAYGSYDVTAYASDKNYGYSYRLDNATQRKNLINFLNDSIPDGNYVAFQLTNRTSDDSNPLLVFDSKNLSAGIDSLNPDKNIINTLKKQGATEVLKLLDKPTWAPYGFIYQKGKNNFKEKLGTDIDDKIDFVFPIQKNWYNGDITSVPIGKAKEWNTLEWKTSVYDNQVTGDSCSLDVYGLDKNLTTATLLLKEQMDRKIDLSKINASDYPYLQLKLHDYDVVKRTPTQLDFWRVYYSGIPELAVNPNISWKFHNDTLQQGETLKMEVAVDNISDLVMDSVLIKFRIQDATNKEVIIEKNYPSLAANNRLEVKLDVPTRQLEGAQRFAMEVNPNFFRAEQRLTNNFLYKDFYVERDRRNPLLDVTFDGMHILDGDIISPKPSILMTVKDENKYFLLDSSKIKIYLFSSSIGDKTPRRIYFDNVELQYVAPTSTAKNSARIEYNPSRLTDGDYQLMVYAEDGSGNHTTNHILRDSTINGTTTYNYSTNFKVITQSSISNVLNYPNPFSTSTQFVYTLTGENSPTYFNIQIMTVAGKVVREITQDELGPMHIGTHRTNYAWDGTDQFGDKLAAGVYLYRIIAKKADGQDFENYELKKADSYFKNGFGKMVILR